MLSKPDCGWTLVTIGDFRASASYLDDVPVMCLEAFINGIRDWLPVCLKFDAEGWHFYLIAEEYHSFVFSNDVNSMEEARILEYDVSMFDLAKQLISDIETSIEGWICWESYNPIKSDSEEYNTRKLKIESLLSRLKDALKERECIMKNSWSSYCEKTGTNPEVGAI